MDKRIVLSYIIFLMLFAGLITRLFYWQVIKADELRLDAKRQYQLGKTIQAPRGSILASDGSFFAGRSIGWLAFAELPKLTQEKEKVSDMLAPLFVERLEFKEIDEYKSAVFDEAGRLKEIFSRSDLYWVSLKHRLTNDKKQKIEKLSLDGIGFDLEELRVYPESSNAAQLLGFVGKNESGEDEGYFGLEGYYDLVLSGKPGFSRRDSDIKGAPIILGENYEVNASSGIDLKTHVDKGIQLLVEERLEEGIERYGAKSGSVIVMNPFDGAIYAMANYPSFDPRKYYKFDSSLFKNTLVTDTFEPGSIFKVVVMSAGINDGKVEADTKCDICDGPVKIDKYSIETWNNEYRKDPTMTDVIVHSDNIGMVFVSQKLGVDNMYKYLIDFGFGDKTGIDLQGEANAGIRDKEDWSTVDLATAGFGQGIAVTPIQMIRAVCVIANGGYLVTPQVVDSLVGDLWEEDIKPEVGEHVISEETSRVVKQMMVEAAKNGEAKWTHVGGFNVAGKTGTAQIPIAGHYDDEKTIASYVGFAPADNPKFVMLVTLREPQSSPWASETAAPLWYDIAKDLFLRFGVQPVS